MAPPLPVHINVDLLRSHQDESKLSPLSAISEGETVFEHYGYAERWAVANMEKSFSSGSEGPGRPPMSSSVSTFIGSGGELHDRPTNDEPVKAVKALEQGREMGVELPLPPRQVDIPLSAKERDARRGSEADFRVDLQNLSQSPSQARDVESDLEKGKGRLFGEDG